LPGVFGRPVIVSFQSTLINYPTRRKTLKPVGFIPMVAAARNSLLDEIRDRGSIRTCHAEAFPWNAVNPETNEWSRPQNIWLKRSE
jgi:hypothetical protein